MYCTFISLELTAEPRNKGPPKRSARITRLKIILNSTSVYTSGSFCLMSSLLDRTFETFAKEEEEREIDVYMVIKM